MKLSLIKALELSEDDLNITEPTTDEVIQAINSVPAIRKKDILIKFIENSARLIKGYPVLTEGEFNGLYYPDTVLQEGAETWLEHEKLGMTRKSKLDHVDSVTARVGHIVNSYYEDGFIKQDILLLDKKAIELYDNGMLDDVSARMRVKIDMEKSTPDKIIVEKLIGIGTDFVDLPACSTCGLDVVMKELSEQVNMEDETMADENKPTEEEVPTEGSEEELAEETVPVGIKDKLISKLAEVIEAVFGEVEEAPEEEMPEEEIPEEEMPEEELEGKESGEQEDEAETEQVPATPETELGDDVDKKVEELAQKISKGFEAKLSKLEQNYKARVKTLEVQLAAQKKEEEQAKKQILVDRVAELSEKFKIDADKTKIGKQSTQELSAKIEAFEAVLSQVPEGNLPKMFDVTLEKQKEQLETDIEELKNKRANVYQG